MLDLAHISQWVSLPGVGGGWLKEETGDRKSDATKKLHDWLPQAKDYPRALGP